MAIPTTSPMGLEQRPTGSREAQAERGENHSQCLVVFGTKGLIGTTTIATHLAVSLTKHVTRPICLVDLDVVAPGGVAKSLRLSVRRTLADVLGALKQDPQRDLVTLESAIIPHSTGVHTLTYLASPRQVNPADLKALAHVLSLLATRYAYLVIDGGKAFTEPLMSALDAAHVALLVITPAILNQYQTKWALGMLGTLGVPGQTVNLVLNRAHPSIHDEVRHVQAAFPHEILGVIPSDEVPEAMERLAKAVLMKMSGAKSATVRLPHPEAQAQAPEPVVTLSSSRLYLAGKPAEADESNEDDVVLMKQRIHARLIEEADIRKLNLAQMTDPATQRQLREKTERIAADLLAQQFRDSAFSAAVRAQLIQEIADEALGLGPLEGLLADPAVTDILVNSKEEIYVERNGKLELTSKRFLSDTHLLLTIERIVAPLGRRIDELTPMVDARLPDGSRVNAIIPPLSLNGPVLSIRKFTHIRYTAADLIRFESLTPAMAQFVQACVQARKNILVSGGAGAGKTTLLDVLSAFIPEGERIVTIEDAAELRLAQAHWVRLEARPSGIEGKGEITIRDLFHNALRMRPDRIIIGECRGAETLDMLQAMNTGHAGSITTVHANSPQDVIRRLDAMILMSNIELPLRAIREMAASALHIIIHTNRLPDGSRKITAISELGGLVNGTDPVFQDLFVFRQTGTTPQGTVLGEFVTTGNRPTFLDEFKVKGIPMNESIFVAGSVRTPTPQA